MCMLIKTYMHIQIGFPGSSVLKNPSANAGDTRDASLIPGSGRSPGEGNGNPVQYSCLENPHEQGCLAGYSSCGRKELDITEWLRRAQHIVINCQSTISLSLPTGRLSGSPYTEKACCHRAKPGSPKKGLLEGWGPERGVPFLRSPPVGLSSPPEQLFPQRDLDACGMMSRETMVEPQRAMGQAPQ